MGGHRIVGEVGLEPTCNQLRFQLCIRQSRYTPILNFCGEGGIRTPGPRNEASGFQDRRNRPLCHLSIYKIAESKTNQNN